MNKVLERTVDNQSRAAETRIWVRLGFPCGFRKQERVRFIYRGKYGNERQPCCRLS